MSKRIWFQHRPCCCSCEIGLGCGIFVIPRWLFYYFPHSLIILRGSHLVLLAHVAPPADQDPDDAGVSVPGAGVQGRVSVLKCHNHEESSESDKLSYVVLQVWLAAVEEQHAAGLVVSVLTAEVKRREPAPVLDVEICF